MTKEEIILERTFENALHTGFNICIETVLEILAREDFTNEEKIELIKSIKYKE